MPIASLRGTRPVAVLLAAGAVVYSAWVLEAVLATGLDPLRTYVSELAAAGRPFGGLFRTTDLIAGLLVLAGALGALVRYRPRGLWDRTGWAALALFGAATAADSRLPLSCAPTVDAACAAREAAGFVPATHAAHAWSSSIASTAAVVAVVALTVAARRHGRHSLLARTGPALAAAELAATAWTLSSIAAFESGNGTWLLGAGQRLQVLLAALWLGLLAWSVAREKLYE
ncbi:hypothetical protein AR457_24500 [Streptomyces agglomeratus]|uniref:DUF998 domain-containing protein n=1 Tax=Streptomyces agglomeratus TaxID=285458 RepID=A0A1E5PCB5_9ACTN|nr:DUF998 domain-containing protein [Streptomyces agglomeratus]OEJ27147.1 hypothetical protein AS594_24380 [Streptomyces agglomeratus]OEJ38803.1 hypothetical protein BGK70_12155 [Streptomyces agglomeratus]OEJ46813.1 hypothetical protein AR457_24500 [Streptomyces agglomeratus]OEJ58700.1 hypothetical protein BGM19_12545 [Streptomyces agglomeratus]